MTFGIPEQRRPRAVKRRGGGGGGGVAVEQEASESSAVSVSDMTSSGGGATGAATVQTPTVIVAANASAASPSSPPSNNNSSRSNKNRPLVGFGAASAASAAAATTLPPPSPKKPFSAARTRRNSAGNTRAIVSNSSNNNSSSNSNSANSMKKTEWLQNVQFATTSGNWEPLRDLLSLTVAAKFQVAHEIEEKNKNKKKRGSSFWRRLSGAGGGGGGSHNNNNSKAAREVSASLLRQDPQGNTPLHAALQASSQHKKAPTDVVLVLLQLEPRAAQVPNSRGQYPLHTAVLNQHELEVIAEIVEAYPDALSKATATATASAAATAAITKASAQGSRPAAVPAASITTTMMTPLSLAVEQAKAATNLTEAPRTFWMTVNPDNDNDAHHAAEAAAAAAAAAAWQENQVDVWATVHWLLLAAATHPQTSLSVGISGNGKSDSRPMLVDALVYAAPPAVVALLIGASVLLLSYENKATAFAGTTLYTCIARHYPLSILQSLACKCPPDVRTVRDETGMGLVAALFISGCFEKSLPLTEEWTLSQDFVAIMLESIEQGELMHHDNVAFMDWWSKIEFLIVFGTGQQYQQQQQQQQQLMQNNNNSNNKSFPKHYLLHAALSNPDVPPLVVRLLLALYPDSLTMPAPKWMQLAPASSTMMTTATDTTTTTVAGGGALLPIHLCCKTYEYIPRNYEMQIMNKHETSLEWVVQASPPQSIMSRYHGRSAFHYAIESGKLYHSLQALLQVDARFLRWRDPVTGLFPCMLAAAYSYKKNAFDSHKWSCVARNKYTHSVWRGLSDRQKAASVYRVAESEDVERLCTIFQLIRQDPIVLVATRSTSSSSSGGGAGGTSIISMADDQSSAAAVTRDSTGMGKVAAHYISWCFKQERKKGAAHVANVENMFVLREAMRLAPSGDFCTSMPKDFETWFNQLKFWIHCCCPKTIPTGRQRPCNSTSSNNNNDEHVSVQKEEEQRLAIPQDQMDRFLLHMAVLNPDTPPAVVALVLAISRMSASIELPGTTDLPLHIACRVPPYTPRIFESSNYSTVQLLAKAYPLATRVMSGGKLPLHIAIDSGKTWNDFKVVVEQEKRALLVRDYETGLYPFQLMATKRPYTQEQRVRFMYMARNRTENSVWKGMQAVSRIQAIRAIQREHELDILSSIFELFRRDASMIKPSSSNDATIKDSSLDAYNEVECKVQVVDDEEEASESKVEVTSCSPDQGEGDNDDDDAESDMSSSSLSSQIDERSRTTGPTVQPSAPGDVSSSDAEGSTSSEGASSRGDSSSECGSERENKAQTALMRLLSQHTRDEYTNDEDKGDPFRCDASILSGVDVMSTLSSTLHSMHSTLHSTRHFPDGHRGSDFISSIHGRLSEADVESTQNASVGTGLAKDSNGSGGSCEFAEDSVASTSSSYPTDFQSLACSIMPDSPESSESSESSSLVFFRMKRRRPKQNDDGEYVQTVRLSKSVPVDNPSVSSASVPSPKGLRQSVLRPLLSESPRTFSTKSIDTFAADSYELSVGDLAQVMEDASSTKKDCENIQRNENLLASLADSGEFDILMNLGGNDDSIGELTGPHGSAGELTSHETPTTPLSQSDISTKPDSLTLTQPSLHPKFVARPPGAAVNMVWITKDKSDSDSDEYPDYGESSIPDLQNVLNPLNLSKDLKGPILSDGDSSSDSTSRASDSGDTETASPELAAQSEEHAAESKTAAESLPASAGIESVKSTNEEIDKDSTKVDSDTGHGTNDCKLSEASCNGSTDPAHVSNGENGQKLASTSKESSFLTPMVASGATNGGDEKLAHQKEPSTRSSKIMVPEKKAAEKVGKSASVEESNEVKAGPMHKEECELATKKETLADGTGKGEVSEPVEVVFFDRATMRWVKRKVENKDESKSETSNIQSTEKSEFKSKAAPAPFPPERPCCEGPENSLPPPKREAAHLDSARSNASNSTMTTSKTPSPPKFFDKKSMRWVARDEVKPEEDISKNEFTAPAPLSSARKEASGPFTPVKPNMDTALIGSPFIELVSRHDIKKRNERLAKATHFAATKPTATMRNSLLCRTPLGSIPESQSGVRSQTLIHTQEHLSCIICQKNKREVLMIPCRHLSICGTCSNEFQSLRDCPVCQEKISDRMFIF